MQRTRARSNGGFTAGLAAVVLCAFSPAMAVPNDTSSAPPRAICINAVFDNSWSMTKSVGNGTRLERAIDAGERWAASLDVPSAMKVELLTASDHVDVVGIFALRSEADRAALIEAIRQIRAVRLTRTLFREIDRELADVVRRDTSADEEFGLLFLSDMISDVPQSDLSAEAMGDGVIDIGGGVRAVLLGNIPARDALARGGTATSRVSAKGSMLAGHSSAVMMLHGGGLRIDGPPTVVGVVNPIFLGGWESVRTDIHVASDMGIPRLVWFEVVASPSVFASISPNPLIVPAGESATATIELSASKPAQGEVAVIARLPDGRSQQYRMQVRLVTRPWLVQHGRVFGVGLLGMALVSPALLWRARRAVRVGDHADPDKQASLAIGDRVPLATFSREATGTLRRKWRGYEVITEGDAASVAGRFIPPGKRGRYRLGEDIQIGSGAFAVYRIDRQMAAATAGDFSLNTPGTGWASGALR